MSLPSGLIFFMDFQHSNTRGSFSETESLYGGGVLGSQLTGGVNISDENGEKSFYALNNGYASPTGSIGTISLTASLASKLVSALTEAEKKALRFDPDLLADPDSGAVASFTFPMSDIPNLNQDNLMQVVATLGDANDRQVRRLTEIVPTGTDAPLVKIVVRSTDAAVATAAGSGKTISYPISDAFTNADALGAVKGTDPWGLEGANNNAGTFDGLERDVIPEIDIKVDSVAVTAMTKKLKAKWTPELGQDLNAYHNLDAEVELTQILSEQIALEIDREIINDLVQGATAGTYYWSRSPGLFVHKTNGTELGASSAAPDFTGTVSEWYETLVETINDVSAQIHRKTLRGGANFLVVSPEVANILEFTSGFRASITADADKGTVGAVKAGSLSKKWDVYVDPYFPRNVVLVGRRGGSFLESGYVYAPYVPLQVTPTIFGTEDFVPRKGVMTRYAKKMVRPDMYGLVIVRGLLGEEGAS